MAKKNKKSEIVKTDSYVRLAGKSLIIEYENTDYITAQSLVQKLVSGTLKTQKGDKSKSIMLGVIDGDEIKNDTGVWLTRKENAFYFAPEENKLLVTSVELIRQLLSGETNKVQLGIFKKE